MLKSMLTRLREANEQELDGGAGESGFTLIELMVVLLIIAILLAIAIPTFLGARNSANSRAAQSNLRNALTAEQTQWTNTQAFDATTTDMTGVESALTWSNAAPTSGNNVFVGIADSGNYVLLEAFGKDGKCYFVEQSNDPTSSYTGYGVEAQNSGACYAPTMPTSLPAAPSAPNAKGGASGNASASGTAPTYYTTW
jgi:type IV pilus assembly protein PilA